MCILLAAFLLASSGEQLPPPSTVVSEPRIETGLAGDSARPELPPPPAGVTGELLADPSKQVLYATIGGGLGTFSGLLGGGLTGALLSAGSRSWVTVAGSTLIGAGVGALVGGGTGAAAGARLARPKGLSHSSVPPAFGGMGGLVVGVVAGAAVMAAIGENNDAVGMACFTTLPSLGAGVGATIVDRYSTPRRFATPSRSAIGIMPWRAREGLVGLRLSVSTGI